MHRALHIFYQEGLMSQLIQSNMSFDFSWEKSAEKYLELYQK
jgi:starch synthase